MKLVTKVLLVSLVLAVTAGLSSAAFCADLGKFYVEEQAGLGLISGFTKYHITFEDDVWVVYRGTRYQYYGESELEFPLSNSIWSTGLVAGFKQPKDASKDTLRFSLNWAANISEDAGTMKDSDWLSAAYDLAYNGAIHNGLDIYSESDSSLSAAAIDFNARYYFWFNRFGVGPLVGFRWQRLKYQITDLSQVGYGGYSDWGATWAGQVGYYEVEYAVPYIGASAQVAINSAFSAGLSLAYAPAAAADDLDRHLLRDLQSTSSCTGTAQIIGINAAWQFKENWRLSLDYEHFALEADGTQHDYDAETGGEYVYDNPINDKIETSQNTLKVGLMYRF